MKMESIVKRYYDALEQGVILGRKCPACGAVEFPPRIACTACGHFEMDWVEMSGAAEVTSVVAPSLMTGAHTQIYQPFVMGCIKTAEGAELNAIIRGISPDMIPDVRQRLPLPVKAAVFPREGYKVVVYELAAN